MKSFLILFMAIEIAISTLQECETEWLKIISSGKDILDPNPSDYTKMFLYSGFTMNNLGQYDPCTDISIAKYTLILLSPSPFVLFALCGPKDCSAEDYQEMLSSPRNSTVISDIIGKQVYNFKLSSHKQLAQAIEFPIIFPKEYVDDHFKDYQAGTIIMIIFIVILSIIVILATFFDYMQSDSSGLEKNNGVKDKSKPIWTNYLLCFSMIANIKKLFISRSQERLGKKDSMELLNGVRVLSIGWVILGHTFQALMGVAVVSNFDHFDDETKKSYVTVPGAGEFSVDTFFWLAGFLGSYLILIELNSSKRFNWVMVYVHRYLRLTPLVLFIMLFFWAFQKHIGSGPMWFTGDELNSPCKNWWYTPLLYINNFVPHYKGSGCLGVAWYLANDMQFFIITPPILYLYHKYSKSIGWIAIGLLTSLSILSSGLVAHHFSFNAVPSAQQNGTNYYFYYYIKPYTRCGPYVIGILAGLIVYSYRRYQDKKEIYDSFAVWVGKKLEDKKIRFIVGFFGLILINLMVFVPYDTIRHPGKNFEFPHWTQDESIAFIAFNKAVFEFGLTLVLLPALLGHFPWVSWILSWDVWTPLARMTFTVYLIHLTIMFICYGSQRVAYIFDEYSMIRDAIFFFVISYVLALPFVIMVEMPALGIEKLMFSSIRKKQVEAKNIKEEALLPLTKSVE